MRAELWDRLGLRPDDSLSTVWSSDLSQRLAGLLFHPDQPHGSPTSLDEGIRLLGESAYEVPPNLVPILPVDNRSIACLVGAPAGAKPAVGPVVRWHLGEVEAEHQSALLDVDALEYVKSIAEELAAREVGLDQMLDEIAPKFKEEYLDQGRRPKPFVVRPMRIACQNVIAAMAAFSQDSTFDGLSVPAWLTCELPHLATHEGARSLAALTLCDAFKNGGTMEIRFDRHPERRVPASLRRFARSRGFEVGASAPASITPAESRLLFFAVTPMPGELQDRVVSLVAQNALSPERVCFTLLSQIWREIEVDYLLATSARSASILEGGAEIENRLARSAESGVCRAAAMAGMFFQRLDGSDSAGAETEVRVLEDNRVGVSWTVVAEHGAIEFSGVKQGNVPWQFGDARPRLEPSGSGEITILPRAQPTRDDIALVAELTVAGRSVGLLVPQDCRSESGFGENVPILFCPDRIEELDIAIERRLADSRITRS